MYSVVGNDITMVRGDTFVTALTLTRNGETYTPVEGDEIIFTVKKNDGDIDPYIRKNVPISTMELKLVPADTSRMVAGTYFYHLEIIFADGAVDTFIYKGSFKLLHK